jgi:hypothetical protein
MRCPPLTASKRPEAQLEATTVAFSTAMALVILGSVGMLLSALRVGALERGTGVSALESLWPLARGVWPPYAPGIGALRSKRLMRELQGLFKELLHGHCSAKNGSRRWRQPSNRPRPL